MHGSNSLLLLLVFAVFMWFVLIRPVRKQQAAAKTMQDTVKPGARVMLTSGIYGTIDEIHDETITLVIAPDVVVDVDRRAVSKVFDDSVDEVDGDADEPDEPDEVPADDTTDLPDAVKRADE